jgi:hypothetical protein
VFFIESEEELAICPNCGRSLVYHSRVVRSLKDITGTEKLYSIRVLRCIDKACPTTYHRELPDTIIPYKRYDAESVEDAIEREGITVAADESTIYRWRKWFAMHAMYMMMALLSVSAVIGDKEKTSSLTIEKQELDKPIETLKGMMARKKNWLSGVVRIMVNSSRWIFNRSAFLSG